MRADPDKNEDLESSSSSDVVSSHRSRSPAVSVPACQGRSCSPVSNHNPLLTATLNAPPQSYYGGLNGNVRVKCPTDLSVTLTVANSKKNDDSPNSDSSHSQGLSTNPQQPSSNQAVFYSTLLKQLRQKAGDGSGGNVSSGGQQIHVVPVPVKIKKEKAGSGSKSLPFMCPACKKRFQRHIAMNAHFQSEHISGPGASGERSCKLCGTTQPSLTHVRNHLRAVHNIDLDNPAKCLVEDPATFQATSKYSVLEASLRSGSSHESDSSEPSCSNIDMSESSRSNSPLPAHHHPSSSEQSPERSLFPIKASVQVEDDNSQVEDLSVRRHVSRGQSPVPLGTRSPRPESPAAKRQRVHDSPSPTMTSVPSQPPSPPPGSKYTCLHCNISYPNQTLYFLHKGFHSDSNPWRCNGCGHQASDLYDFNSHLFSVAHQ